MTTRLVATEADLQAQVLELAKLFGWRHVHFRPARTAHGWRTPFTGDPGFPDLVLCRPPRLIFAELKSDSGRMGEGQLEWLDDLAACGDDDVESHVWRPADFDRIVEALR